MKYGEVPAERALQIVRDSFSHDDVTRLTGLEYSFFQRRKQEVVLLPEDFLEQHAEDSILVPMHLYATVLAVAEVVKERSGGNHHVKPWLRNEEFATSAFAEGWILMLKDEVPGTLELDRPNQCLHLTFGQNFPWACERVFGEAIYYLHTGQSLTQRKFLRCQDQLPSGSRIIVGGYDDYGLLIDIDPDIPGSNVGAAGLWRC